MANMKNKKAVRLKSHSKTVSASGMNVYYDQRDQPVYYDRFTKKAYLLKDVEKTYQLYSMRFFLSFSAMVLIYAFSIPLWGCVLLGVAIYAFMEFKFRRFLSRLTQYRNFIPEQKVSRFDAESQAGFKKVLIKLILFLLLGVLLILNAYQEQYEGIVLYLHYLLAAFSFIMCIFECVVLIKMKK